MAIPIFQEIMSPMLKLLGDGKKQNIADVIDQLAKYFKLSKAEQTELLPSGRIKKFQNRSHWARFYLVKAGLLNSPERGFIEITSRGQKILKENPSEIDISYLKKFKEFKDFLESSTKKDDAPSSDESPSATPEELLEAGYNKLSKTLASELISKIKSTSPAFFEKLVVELLLKMGYGGSRKDAGEAIGKSHDGGIDGVIKEDKLGLDVIYIQAKKWENSVGRPVVQAFVGSLEGFRAQRGILITTSSFSGEAKNYVETIGKRIILIDGDTLVQLMIDYNVGVSVIATFDLKKIDTDFFIDE